MFPNASRVVAAVAAEVEKIEGEVKEFFEGAETTAETDETEVEDDVKVEEAKVEGEVKAEEAKIEAAV